MKLPNVRKIFIPDPGYIIIDADLSGADAQVVAAEAQDDKLLKGFASGLDLHTVNATEMWGDAFTRLQGPARRSKRQAFKAAVHATNYGASTRALVLNPAIGFTQREADLFQAKWFSLHPGIRAWHRRTEDALFKHRTVSNRFGYRIIYFDRIEALLPQALAWVPQSTIAETCFRGALQLERVLPFVEILLQVHDSLVFQIPRTHLHYLPDIATALRVPIPYDPPLVIKWKISISAKSWGDCKEVDVNGPKFSELVEGIL